MGPRGRQEEMARIWHHFTATCQQERHNITEFVIDTKELKTGISCRMFNESGEDYDNLVTFAAARI